MTKRLQLLCSILLLCMIMTSCSRFIHSGNGGFSDVSLNRNSDEYTLKRLDPIELSGSSLFGIPGFGTNNKNKKPKNMDSPPPQKKRNSKKKKLQKKNIFFNKAEPPKEKKKRVAFHPFLFFPPSSLDLAQKENKTKPPKKWSSVRSRSR